MKHDPGLRPRGFGGNVDSVRELLSQRGSVLTLPADGIPDGPFLRIPKGRWDAIHVDNLTEALGNVEAFVAAAASHLKPEGVLVLEVENLQAPRSLRFVLEGRPGSLDPVGSTRQPERRLHKKRALQAIADTGLVLEDVYEVPSQPTEAGPELCRNLFREGFLAVSYIAGPPPSRFWLVARRVPLTPGTAIVGPGSPADQAHTVQCLRGFLPAGWDVVACSPDREASAFNDAVSGTTGDVLWFLRAGATVDRQLFQNQRARTVISPSAPGTGPALANPGDLSGLMVSRLDVLQTGPMLDSWRSDRIAYEDWGMRLEAATRSVHGESGGFSTPAPATDPESFAAEGEQLIAQWGAIEKDGSGHVSQDDPRVRTAPAKSPPWAGREPRVSLCMIVRNEERFLDRCLSSAAPCVDEMVIVDTGSIDRTIEIAQNHGAKVIESLWQEDFAAARNVALDHATGDWVLSLDADEVMGANASARIRELVQDPGISGYHMRFNNLYTSKETVGVIMVRLFRRLEGVRWENRIHEQITPSLAAAAGREGLITSICDVDVEHHGYMDDVMEDRSKDERNDRLFQLHLEEHPNDVYMLYKYGDFLRRTTSRWAEARDYLRRAFDLIVGMPPSAPRTMPFASEIVALLVLEYMREDRRVEAQAILEHALAHFIATPNLHYLAASLALANEESDEAIRQYQHCLAYRDQVLVVPIQDGITSYVSITGIAQAWLQKGDLERAERLLVQSQTIEPAYDVTALSLSRVRFEQRDLPGALQVLTDYLRINPESAGVCQQASLLLAQAGMTEKALDVGSHAVQLLERQSLVIEANQLRESLTALQGAGTAS